MDRKLDSYSAFGNNRISHLVVGWLVANGGEVAEWIQDSTETTVNLIYMYYYSH